jgi:hypothetical protein
MLPVPIRVARPHLVVAEAKVQHRLPDHDVEVDGVAAAEVLGVVGPVRGRFVGHRERLALVAIGCKRFHRNPGFNRPLRTSFLGQCPVQGLKCGDRPSDLPPSRSGPTDR